MPGIVEDRSGMLEFTLSVPAHSFLSEPCFLFPDLGRVYVKQRPFFFGMGAAIIRPCYREADVGLRQRAGNPNCGLRVI